MSEDPVLLCSDRNGVRTLTLNRPQRKNAINRDLWIALADALTAAGNDRGVCAVVIPAPVAHSAQVPTSPAPTTVTRCTSCNG